MATSLSYLVLPVFPLSASFVLPVFPLSASFVLPVCPLLHPLCICTCFTLWLLKTSTAGPSFGSPTGGEVLSSHSPVRCPFLMTGNGGGCDHGPME